MLMTEGYFRPKPNHFAKKKLFFPREASSAVFLPLPRVVLWLVEFDFLASWDDPDAEVERFCSGGLSSLSSVVELL